MLLQSSMTLGLSMLKESISTTTGSLHSLVRQNDSKVWRLGC